MAKAKIRFALENHKVVFILLYFAPIKIELLAWFYFHSQEIICPFFACSSFLFKCIFIVGNLHKKKC